MNCKPNDLAWVNKVLDPKQQWAIGRVVRVIEIVHTTEEYGPIWKMEDPVVGPDGTVYKNVYDCILKPFDPDSLEEPESENLTIDHPVCA